MKISIKSKGGFAPHVADDRFVFTLEQLSDESREAALSLLNEEVLSVQEQGLVQVGTVEGPTTLLCTNQHP